MSCLWLVLKYKRMHRAETLKEEWCKSLRALSVASRTVICGSDVTRWQPRAEWPFDRRSLQSSHQRRSWASQSEPSAHRCTRLSPAYSCCCPSEGASEEGRKERARMNGVPETEGDLCWVAAHSCLHLSFIQFQRCARLKTCFSGDYNPHLSFEGNERKNQRVCCD